MAQQSQESEPKPTRFWLSANFWTIVGGLASVVGIFVAVALAMFDRQVRDIFGRDVKALKVETISVATVADLTDPMLAQLRLTFHDEPISRVVTASIEIGNVGGSPIEARDFERPLVLRFANGKSSLLAATVADRQPPNITPEVTVGLDVVSIAPLLLNAGDLFRLNVVLRDGFTEPSVDARIAGISQAVRSPLANQRTSRPRQIALVVASIGATLWYGYLGAFFSPTAMGARRVAQPRRAEAWLIMISGAALAGATTSAAVRSTALPRSSVWVLASMTIVVLAGGLLGMWRRLNETRRLR